MESDIKRQVKGLLVDTFFNVKNNNILSQLKKTRPIKRCRVKVLLSSSVIDDRNSNAALACHGFLRFGTFYTGLGIGLPEYGTL